MNTVVGAPSRSIFLIGTEGDDLRAAIEKVATEHSVTAGYLHGSGVFATIDVHAANNEGASSVSVAFAHATVDATIGSLEGRPLAVLHGVVRPSSNASSGEPTPPGQVSVVMGALSCARIVSFHGWLHVVDGIDIPCILHADTGCASIAPVAKKEVRWADAVTASEALSKPLEISPKPGSLRPPARKNDEADDVFPEAGDTVDHFAFGHGEVVRSDGDRLLIRAGKEGRVREIALEILKVTELPSSGPRRHFKLQRKG